MLRYLHPVTEAHAAAMLHHDSHRLYHDPGAQQHAHRPLDELQRSQYMR